MLVEGEVETQDTAGVVKGAVERFPPSLYLRETPQTRADDAIAAFAADLRPTTAEPGGADGTLSTLHSLLCRIHEDIAWDTGQAGSAGSRGTAGSASGTVGTAGSPIGTAAAAFAARRGSCGDMAHIFIAAARSLGVPARYVAGYLCGEGVGSLQSAGGTGSSQSASGEGSWQTQNSGGAAGFADAGSSGAQHATQVLSGETLSGDTLAGHAWAEAYLPGLGWIGFDPASKLCVTDRHIRVAMGLDHLGAAPLRGAQSGGGSAHETLAVRVTVVPQSAWQAQG